MKPISRLINNPYSSKTTLYEEAYWNTHSKKLKETGKKLKIENDIATKALIAKSLRVTGAVSTAIGSYSLYKGYLPSAVSGFIGTLISYCPQKTFEKIAQKCCDAPKKIISKLASSKIN